MLCLYYMACVVCTPILRYNYTTILIGMKGYFKSTWPNTEHGFYWTSDFDLSLEYNIMYICDLSMKS